MLPASVRCDERLLQELEQTCRAAWPREACGLLAGRHGADCNSLVTFVPLPNAAAVATAFVVAPHAFAAAAAAVQGQGLELLGFAHSHPDGEARPSAADLRQLWAHCVQLIAAVGAGGTFMARAFWLHAGTAVALPLQVGRRPLVPLPSSGRR